MPYKPVQLEKLCQILKKKKKQIINVRFSGFAFFSQTFAQILRHFAQILRHFAQSCDCIIATFRNSGYSKFSVMREFMLMDHCYETDKQMPTVCPSVM